MNGSFLLGCSPSCWVDNSSGDLNIPLNAEQYLAEMTLIGFQGVELNLPLQKELNPNCDLISFFRLMDNTVQPCRPKYKT